jgi:hypothetical protein
VAVTCRNVSLDSLIDRIIEIRRELKRLSDPAAFSPEEKDTLCRLLQDLKHAFYQISDLCIPK